MKWKVTTLDLGQVELNMSRMIPNAEGGARVRPPVQGWLLTGGDATIVIDTGFRNPDILKRIGDRARGIETPEQRLEAQLALNGVKPSDVRYVLHTHLHIDHAGQTDIFPMSTTAVVNRRELEYAVSGLSGPSYPPEDIKHMIDRLHSPGSLRLLDLELTHQEEIVPGVRCAVAGGHTEGSMLVYVDTDEGLHCFCGDLIYSIQYQLLAPRINDRDPGLSANYVVPRRSEKAALKRLLASADRFVLHPSHDVPVTIERGLVVEGSFASSEGCGMGGCWCRVLELETEAAG
ncbi:MAG: N-acyl homoserine lactonase family protein [Burkholderiales bacterium]|nr:MAG: N-acyl homoserine lactonase family protein [Burkholderiales bacterium]